MHSLRHPGFTLIELLVVVSIIGTLATLTTVSLNGARAKARDAKRLNDVRQMANALAVEGTEGDAQRPLEGSGCGSQIAVTDTHNCTGPGVIAQFSRFNDPAVSGNINLPLCTNVSVSTCRYALAEGSTTVHNALIYFFLEENVANLGQGLHVITPEGNIVDLD